MKPVALVVAPQWRFWLLAAVGCAVLLRLLYAAEVELLPEEAYYWNYSRHLDYGYLDHPPMVAWLIRAGTTLFGDTEFGVRFSALCCGGIAGVFVYGLSRNLCGGRCAPGALALCQCLPYFFLSGLLMTPDAPLCAAWAAALYFLERALIGAQPRAWAGAGLSIGLGLLSKYTILLLVLGALAFVLFDPPSRRWLRCWQPYAALLLAAAVFAPVIVWNAEHEWASFLFQTSRRLAERPRFALHALLGSVLVLLTPFGAAAALQALRVQTQPPRAATFLTAATLAPLAVFALFSLRHEVKLDWTGAPWTAALPLMALAWSRAAAPEAKAAWLRRGWPATLGVLLVLYAAGLYHLVRGIPSVGYVRQTELVPVGWRALAAHVQSVAASARAEGSARVLVVGMDRYALASELAFYSADRQAGVAGTTAGHLFGQVGLMYERWFPPATQAGSSLLLVAWSRSELSDALLAPRTASLGVVTEGTLTVRGRLVRRYYYRLARGYKYPQTSGHDGT